MTVEENDEEIFATPTVEGDETDLTFSLSGPDAALIDLDTRSGALRFAEGPDAERPGDDDGDNLYRVTVRLENGRGDVDVVDVNVTVEDVPERFTEQIYADGDLREIRDVQFGTAPGEDGDRDLFFDVILPPETDDLTDRPVVLAFFGGGFVAGNRAGAEALARDFAQRGYVGVTADYRLLDGPPATQTEYVIGIARSIQDGFAAVRTLREGALNDNPYGIDPDAIFVSGLSAGAVIALGLGHYDPSDSFGDVEVDLFLEENGGIYGRSSDNTNIPNDVAGVFALSGSIADVSAFDDFSAPTYAAHNEFDPIVPCRTDAEGIFGTGLVSTGPCVFVPVLQELGIPAELFLDERSVGHVQFGGPVERAVLFEDAAAFLAEIYFDGRNGNGR